MEIWNGKSDEFWAILDTHTQDRVYNLHHTRQSLIKIKGCQLKDFRVFVND